MWIGDIILIGIFWVVFAIGLYILIDVILSEFCNIERIIRNHTTFSCGITKCVLILFIEIAIFVCIHIASSMAYSYFFEM